MATFFKYNKPEKPITLKIKDKLLWLGFNKEIFLGVCN